MAENKDKQAEELEALKTENAQLKALVQEQADALAKAEEEVKASGKYPSFDVAKKTYELVVPKSKVSFNGKMVDVTAKSLKEDKKLLAYCVEQGYGCLLEKGANA